MSPSIGQISSADGEAFSKLLADEETDLARELIRATTNRRPSPELRLSIDQHPEAVRWLIWYRFGGASRTGGVLLSGGLYVPGPRHEPRETPSAALVDALIAQKQHQQQSPQDLVERARELLSAADASDQNLAVALALLVRAQ